MTLAEKRFAQLLTEAIHRIRLREGKTVQIVQDELGYLLGREGGSAIEYWRKGHLPAKLAEVEMLAREMVLRGNLEQTWLEQFLKAAGHPQAGNLLVELFPIEGGQDTVVAGPAASGPGLPSIDMLPPFIVGPPVTHPFQFFGRGRELRRLFNLWKRPPLQNAALIGPRRAGKTSLLHYIRAITMAPPEQLRPGQQQDWLPNPAQYRWVFVDFQDARLGSRDGLMRFLLARLDFPVPAHCDLDGFLDVMSEHLQQPTIIMFDEIGVALERYSELDDPFWESLRSLATNQVGGRLAFILASPEPPERLAQQSNLGSPFFNIFGYTAPIGPLTEPEARELLAAIPRPIPAVDVDWILTNSQGWPVLAQILCREWFLAHEEGETGPAWREDGLAQMKPFAAALGLSR
jgi:hypothetical protein